MSRAVRLVTAAIGFLAVAPAAFAQTSDGAELAKKLSNPAAGLISVPFQNNYNAGYPEGDGDSFILNIQPVVPVSLSPNWNLISRTILPIYSQDIPARGPPIRPRATTQSFFFSPKKPTSFGLIWGVGPAFLIPPRPTGDRAEQVGRRLTGVALKQSGPSPYGALANHIWSLPATAPCGDFGRPSCSRSSTTPRRRHLVLPSTPSYLQLEKRRSGRCRSTSASARCSRSATIGSSSRSAPATGPRRPRAARRAGARASWSRCSSQSGAEAAGADN